MFGNLGGRSKLPVGKLRMLVNVVPPFNYLGFNFLGQLVNLVGETSYQNLWEK